MGWRIIPNATLSPPECFCIKRSSDESRFNVSLIVWGKVTRLRPQITVVVVIGLGFFVLPFVCLFGCCCCCCFGVICGCCCLIRKESLRVIETWSFCLQAWSVGARPIRLTVRLV